VFTIWSECGGIDGKTVTMLGDLKHGRTVHSLAKLLALFDGITINYVSPGAKRFRDTFLSPNAWMS
jgi:aspartate carbamoyltransferase catalytic subunit